MWGPRLYLIEANRVVSFCNAVNAGDEPRKESRYQFLLREGDWTKEAKGSPKIPKPWQGKYLLVSPVQTVTRVVGDYVEDVMIPEYPHTNGKLSGIRCTFNAGHEQGLRPGMTILPQEQYLLCMGFVLSTSPNSCEVLVSKYTDSNEKMRESLLAGLRFSTRRFVAPKK